MTYGGKKSSKSKTGQKPPLPWWRGAVIYQIYPRSFRDSNGDGVGDLRRCIDGLDYVALLDVDAVWLSPFFKSLMDDFGYDVAANSGAAAPGSLSPATGDIAERQ